jgi:hypothetical protein
MKIRPFIKLIIFWFLIFVLSCASGPRVKEIAALHYGDDEANVVQTIGEGSELLFFELDDTQYHYRFYTTTLTEHKYALLFADGRLFAVSEERPPFHECVYQTEWEQCFTAAISTMQVMQMEMDENEFSTAVTEQEDIEKARTTAVVVGTPVLIVTWPIILGMGAACAATEATFGEYHPIDDMDRSIKESECRKALDATEDRIDLLYPAAGLTHTIDVLNDTSLSGSEGRYIKADESIFNLSDRQRRIYGKLWSCGYNQSLNLTVHYGFKNDRMVWVSKNLYPNIGKRAFSSAPEAMFQRYWNDPQHKDAKKWLCRAADTGYSEAQYRLGLLYENGSEGVPKDSLRAYMWYQISVSAGDYTKTVDRAKRERAAD